MNRRPFWKCRFFLCWYAGKYSFLRHKHGLARAQSKDFGKRYHVSKRWENPCTRHPPLLLPYQCQWLLCIPERSWSASSKTWLSPGLGTVRCQRPICHQYSTSGTLPQWRYASAYSPGHTRTQHRIPLLYWWICIWRRPAADWTKAECQREPLWERNFYN